MTTSQRRPQGEPRPCLECGKIFYPRQDLIRRGMGKYCSRQCSADAKQTVKIATETLVRMYTQENKTLKEIQDETGMNGKAVLRRLVAEGVPPRNKARRPKKERRSVQAHGHPNATTGGQIQLYRLRATEKYGRPIQKGELVHHIDGDPTNDEMDNLVILTRAQHNQIHAQIVRLAFSLVKKRIIEYDADKVEYRLNTAL